MSEQNTKPTVQLSFEEQCECDEKTKKDRFEELGLKPFYRAKIGENLITVNRQPVQQYDDEKRSITVVNGADGLEYTWKMTPNHICLRVISKAFKDDPKVKQMMFRIVRVGLRTDTRYDIERVNV